MPALKILATGMSGPVGAGLLPSLAAAGHGVTRLVRHATTGTGEIQWDPAVPISPDAVSGFDAVIHMAGETIVGRWTAAKKSRMYDSRVAGTQHLVEALSRTSQRPRVLINASAIGYYGDRNDEPLTESSPPGNNFLSKLCQDWEAAAESATRAGIRVVRVRIGMILSPTGGALKQMLPPFKFGLGGRMGSGRQYMSWVSIDDVVGAIQYALNSETLQGPVNLVTPNPVTNTDFARTLAGVLHRPAIFPMPAFAVRAAFGQMGDELLLASARVLPTKLQSAGYKFRHPELRPALSELLHR